MFDVNVATAKIAANYPKAPVLEYKVVEKGGDQEVQYRWVADANGFNMPLKVRFAFGPWRKIYPTHDWQTITFPKMKGWFNPAYELQYFGAHQLIDENAKAQN